MAASTVGEPMPGLKILPTTFGAPKVDPSRTDVSKMDKLAIRVNKALAEHAIFAQPKQLDTDQVLVSPLNRMGAPPNVRHIHDVILHSIVQNGWDSQRPCPGICVKVSDPVAVRQLIDYNLNFIKGSGNLLPPILEQVQSGPVYASLAGTHLNLALKILKHNSSSTQDITKLLEAQSDLKDAAGNGHKWWILPESLDKEHGWGGVGMGGWWGLGWVVGVGWWWWWW